MNNDIPAYMRIRQYVIDLALQAGQKQVKISSERELCAIFGVSRPTVRRSLQDLIEGGYLIACPGKGTFTNPHKFSVYPTGKQSVSLGLVMGDGKVISHYGYSLGLMTGIIEQSYEKGIAFRQIELLNTGDMVLEELLHMRVDAIVWAFPSAKFSRTIKALQQKGISVVTINREIDPFISSVCMDFVRTGNMAAEWFLDQKISEVVYAAKQKSRLSSELAFKGFHNAFVQRGLEYNTKLALTVQGDDLSVLKKNNLVNDLCKMLKSGRKIDGIYIDGAFVFHVMEAFRQCNLEFPGDYIVLAHDSFNRESGIFSYPVIEDPLKQIGSRAVEIAVQQILMRSSAPVHEVVVPKGILSTSHVMGTGC